MIGKVTLAVVLMVATMGPILVVKSTLKNGAKVVSSQPTANGDLLTIQLPDGRQFTFLHGTSN